jgi:hypothetical protein
MHWLREGTEFQMPSRKDAIAAARLTFFGNWLRVATQFEQGAECTVLVTLHLKA